MKILQGLEGCISARKQLEIVIIATSASVPLSRACQVMNGPRSVSEMPFPGRERKRGGFLMCPHMALSIANFLHLKSQIDNHNPYEEDLE